MIATPLLISLHAVLERRLAGAQPAPQFDDMQYDEPRVIIAGFGRFGQIVARVLRARRIRFTALEASQTQADFVRRFGNKLYYGDASRLDILRAAGAGRAELLVLAIDDVEASVRTAELARKHFPRLRVLARARNRQHAFRLIDLGVEQVQRETLRVEPGNGRGGAGDARLVPRGGGERRPPLPRARRGDAGRAGCDEGRRGEDHGHCPGLGSAARAAVRIGRLSRIIIAVMADPGAPVLDADSAAFVMSGVSIAIASSRD